MKPRKTDQLKTITVFIIIIVIGCLTYASVFKLCKKKLPYNFTLPLYLFSTEITGFILDLIINDDVHVDGGIIDVFLNESPDTTTHITVIMTGRIIEDIAMLISLFVAGLLTVWFLRFPIWIQISTTFLCFTTGILLLILHRTAYAYIVVLTKSTEKGVIFYRHAWPISIVFAIAINFLVMLLLKNLIIKFDDSGQNSRRKHLPSPLTISKKYIFITAGLITAINLTMILVARFLDYSRY